MDKIQFFSEDITFDMMHQNTVKSWIQNIAEEHNFTIEALNYIFCSDDYLLDINKTYLNHDYYTDIITFDNSQEDQTLLSDVFVSIDRIKENARDLNIEFTKELHRVLIHGVIHLFGYSDQTEEEKLTMRQKEDTCLSQLKI